MNKTTAIVFTDQEQKALREVTLDLISNSHSDYQVKNCELLASIHSKIKILTEPCSGATLSAAEEHLNAR